MLWPDNQICMALTLDSWSKVKSRFQSLRETKTTNYFRVKQNTCTPVELRALLRWVGAECSTFWVRKENTTCLTFWVRKGDNCFTAFSAQNRCSFIFTGLWSKIKRETPCPCFHMLPSFDNYFFPSFLLCFDGSFHVSQEKRMFLPFWAQFVSVWSSSSSSLCTHQLFWCADSPWISTFRIIVTARFYAIPRLVSHLVFVIRRNN